MVLPCSALISRGFVTSRNTSVFLSSARAMRDPASCGAISRTIVSTSGSSGTLDLAPGDVPPPGLALEHDALGGGAAGFCRGGDVRAEPRHGENSPSRRAQAAVRIAKCAGMKNDHIVAERFRRRQEDGHAFFRVVRIA